MGSRKGRAEAGMRWWIECQLQHPFFVPPCASSHTSPKLASSTLFCSAPPSFPLSSAFSSPFVPRLPQHHAPCEQRHTDILGLVLRISNLLFFHFLFTIILKWLFPFGVLTQLIPLSSKVRVFFLSSLSANSVPLSRMFHLD